MSLILTTAGLAAYALADTTGTKLQATHMAVGDGGGESVAHTHQSVSLVNETWRGSLQEIKIAASGEVEFVVHVPITVGGWYIREVAIYADDVLLAIGAHPELWKPAPESPDKVELVITAPVLFDNAETLSLTVDTTKVLASQEHVAEKIIEHDTSVDAHEDIRGLMPVNATTTVRGIIELATNAETTTGTDTVRAVTPAGLAAALGGLAAAQATTEAPGIVELATNAETITGTDSERAVTPAADAAALTEHNGSNTAHEDIRAMVAACVPTGVVITWPTANLPDGYLECDGAALSRTTYANLFAALGIVYGSGDGSTTFNLPDYRGEFHRGLDHGRGADPDAATRTDRGDGTTGDAVGSKQMDEFDEHRHSCTTVYSFNNGTSSASATVAVPSSSNPFTGYSGGSETRPRNVNVIYCIKY